jgi:membrane protein DedA with SNARE-associated domain
MEKGLLDLHNLMRWVILVIALITIFRSLGGMNGGKPFTSGARKTALFLMIASDIQLLLGFFLYYTKGWFDVLGGGGVMSNAYNRFFAVEHMAGMLIALILIHIGYSATKKDIPDASKYKKLFWYTLIALVLILVSIPWPFREAVARPWFPGMNV